MLTNYKDDYFWKSSNRSLEHKKLQSLPYLGEFEQWSKICKQSIKKSIPEADTLPGNDIQVRITSETFCCGCSRATMLVTKEKQRHADWIEQERKIYAKLLFCVCSCCSGSVWEEEVGDATEKPWSVALGLRCVPSFHWCWGPWLFKYIF